MRCFKTTNQILHDSPDGWTPMDTHAPPKSPWNGHRTSIPRRWLRLASSAFGTFRIVVRCACCDLDHTMDGANLLCDREIVKECVSIWFLRLRRQGQNRGQDFDTLDTYSTYLQPRVFFFFLNRWFNIPHTFIYRFVNHINIRSRNKHPLKTHVREKKPLAHQ